MSVCENVCVAFLYLDHPSQTPMCGFFFNLAFVSWLGITPAQWANVHHSGGSWEVKGTEAGTPSLQCTGVTEKHEAGCPCNPGGTSVLFTSIEVAKYVAICLQVYSTGAVEDLGSIPGSGRSPRGGHGNPLQYSGLENPTDRGDQQATVHGVTMNRTVGLPNCLMYFD